MDRIVSVEGEANGRLNRLDQIVDLDAEQEDQMFFLIARSSHEYIPSMEIEGMTGDRSTLDHNARNAAIRSLMRPEQQELFDEHRANRHQEVYEEMMEVGLRPPQNWQLFVDDDW